MLAHSLLSRNKSDCQTDYKLRNFGNRNYLHAAAKIQLFIVGVKISKMENSKFNQLSFEEMDSISGGWKFFGKERSGGDMMSIAGNGTVSQQQVTTTTYVFGFVSNTETSIQEDGIDP